MPELLIYTACIVVSTWTYVQIPGDGVITGHGQVNGRLVFVFSQVGSLSSWVYRHLIVTEDQMQDVLALFVYTKLTAHTGLCKKKSLRITHEWFETVCELLLARGIRDHVRTCVRSYKHM